jgi:hypothetical protein
MRHSQIPHRPWPSAHQPRQITHFLIGMSYARRSAKCTGCPRCQRPTLRRSMSDRRPPSSPAEPTRSRLPDPACDSLWMRRTKFCRMCTRGTAARSTTTAKAIEAPCRLRSARATGVLDRRRIATSLANDTFKMGAPRHPYGTGRATCGHARPRRVGIARVTTLGGHVAQLNGV